MGWLWFGKKQKEVKVPRRWYIPKDKILEYYQLLDARRNGGNVENYMFWRTVFYWFGLSDNVGIKFFNSNVLMPYIEEILEYDDEY